jgi:hypothetical protein
MLVGRRLAVGALRSAVDATAFPADPGHGYDLVTFTDCLHDRGDPVAAAHARLALAPGGTTMIIEPLAADRLEDDLTNPYARIGYAISTLVCTPSSLAQPGAAALGAMAGEARLRQVLAEAGYTRVRRVAQEAATSCWRPGRERADVPRRAALFFEEFTTSGMFRGAVTRVFDRALEEA